MLFDAVAPSTPPPGRSQLADALAKLSVLRDEVKRRQAAQQAATGLLPFTLYTHAGYEANWHHRVVAEALDDVLAGKTRRLIILEPPQNGKSEQVSRRFPAFAFGRNPKLRIIACSYSSSLAQDMSRDVQKIMMSPEYHQVFPGTRLASPSDSEKRTQGQFDIVGHNGYYYAAGVDGPITGKSADIGIIDDPVKNRAEAESEVYRERVWDWYISAFATRQFGNKGAIIICLTRWHEDDLVGRLLRLAKENPKAEQWRVITLPAIAETVSEEDPRQPGEALWPDKYPLEELARRRVGMGEYDWSALYQQHPTPPGGGLIKREWFAGKFVDVAPVKARRARGWDTAGTENGGDWTVGVRIAETGGLYYVEDVQRKQVGPDGVDKLMLATAELDGRGCRQREEKEGGSSGLAVISARTKSLAAFDYAGVSISGSKVTRSKPFRSQCEAGNVFVVRGPWNTDYINELCDFPTGKNDDQVDGSSCAFNDLVQNPGVSEDEFVSW